MIEKRDVEFIKESFYYALDRMKSLPIETWGSYEEKQKRITETEKRQIEIIQKLREITNQSA
jgi:hypothetical protein